MHLSYSIVPAMRFSADFIVQGIILYFSTCKFRNALSAFWKWARESSLFHCILSDKKELFSLYMYSLLFRFACENSHFHT